MTQIVKRTQHEINSNINHHDAAMWTRTFKKNKPVRGMMRINSLQKRDFFHF